MHDILINNDKLKFLKACGGTDSVDRLQIWAEILSPKDDFLITGTNNKRHYSSYTLMELKMLYRNTTGEELPTEEYSKALEYVLLEAQRFELDDTGLAELKKKLGKPLPKFSPKPAPEKEAPIAKEPKPKPKKEPSVMPSRPKPGSKTAKVWDFADELAPNCPGWQDHWKEFKKLVLDKCEEDGINSNTASVQLTKWKKVQG